MSNVYDWSSAYGGPHDTAAGTYDYGNDPWGYATQGLDPSVRDAMQGNRQQIGGLVQQSLDAIGQQPGYAGKQTMGAEGQLWQGIAAQRAAMQGQAGRNGFNPDLSRAANYAGGSMEAQGWNTAQQLRAAAEQRRRQAILQAHQAGSQAEMQQEGIDQQNIGETQATAQADYQQGMKDKQANKDYLVNSIGSAIKSIGTAGAMSDARAKQNAYQAGRADQDELIRGMGATGNIFESRLRGDAPPQADPRARMLAGQFFQAGLAQAQQGNYQGAAQAFDHANAIAPHPDAAANAARARDDHAGMLAGALDQLGSRTEAQLRGPDNTAAIMAGLDQTDAEMRRRLQDDAIGHMRGQTWEYKPEVQRDLGLPPGRHFGPMAQQLERSPLTAGAVRDTPTGKRVDVPMLTMAHSGAIGRLGERLDALEGR